MLVTLSTKGQLVLPKSVRDALHLRSGDQVQVRIVDGRIVLEPMREKSSVDVLFGKYTGYDLLTGLEDEHRWEINRE